MHEQGDRPSHPAPFFSLLLILTSTLMFYRRRRQIPIETVKLFRRQIFVLESGERSLIDGIFNGVVKI